MVSLDPGMTVFELTEQFPSLVEALARAGFPDVRIPAVRQTAGRIMTLEKGIAFRGLDPGTVYGLLEKEGFRVDLPIMKDDEM